MSRVSILENEDEAVSEERRRSPRADLLVRIDYTSVDELFSEFIRDVNEGGLFIETDKPRPVGTEVSMHLNLPGDGEAIQTTGRVVRTSHGEGGSAPGMGLEFDELSDEARSQINLLIRSLKIGPGAG